VQSLNGNESGNGNLAGASDGVLHVAFVLDKSGSLQIVEEAVVAAYNDYLQEFAARAARPAFR
jgi:hypothetical protein